MLRRCRYIAHSVEVALSKRLRGGYCILIGCHPVAFIVHLKAGSWTDFLADRAVDCEYVNAPGVVHFDEASGWLRVRTEHESAGVFLSSELNVELKRILYEAAR